mmetsp:Transcript_19597/g.51983  ORF Transcript_19597/g.51983 Transcript_19597/m.51983 type:complete len:249 (-) Transcript_19597:83-829(-)
MSGQGTVPQGASAATPDPPALSAEEEDQGPILRRVLRCTTEALGPVTLSAEEEQKARATFAKYDLDKTGAMDIVQIRELLEEIAWCMDNADIKNVIGECFGADVVEFSYNDFTKVYRTMLAKQPPSVRRAQHSGRTTVQDLRQQEANSRALFKEMDEHGTGYLTTEAMRLVMRELRLPDTDGDDYEAVVLDHMRFADRNNDDKISFEEFILYRNAVLDHHFLQVRRAQERDHQTVEDDDPFSYDKFLN